MTESLLARLLNDESFIRWVEGEPGSADNKKWDAWLLENPAHQTVVKKAKKMLNMPFQTFPTADGDMPAELQRLKEQLHNREK